ncbi:hypothetical protein STEG23_033068, partial [Scotinomys teguina]
MLVRQALLPMEPLNGLRKRIPVGKSSPDCSLPLEEQAMKGIQNCGEKTMACNGHLRRVGLGLWHGNSWEGEEQI